MLVFTRMFIGFRENRGEGAPHPKTYLPQAEMPEGKIYFAGKSTSAARRVSA
jgi:hypothetical protein